MSLPEIIDQGPIELDRETARKVTDALRDAGDAFDARIRNAPTPNVPQLLAVIAIQMAEYDALCERFNAPPKGPSRQFAKRDLDAAQLDGLMSYVDAEGNVTVRVLEAMGS